MPSRIVALLLLSSMAGYAAAAAAYQKGDRVEVYHYGWYPGTVEDVGTGANAGRFLVKRDQYPTTPEWHKADDLKTAAQASAEKGADADAVAQGPRPGRYGVWSHGAGKLYFGELELLSGGRYQVWKSDKTLSGTGNYQYDAKSTSVIWVSGPYQGIWEGRFESRAGGKVHSIYLKRNVVASNGI